jgi:hypothetical protein
MSLRNLCCFGLLASATLASPLAQALEADVVDSKFASVIVLAPVTEAGELRPIADVGMVAFFSPLAANLFAQGWRKRTGNKEEFRVAPLSLTEFEAAFLTAREKNDNLSKAYVPDPAQIPAAVGLQMQQGVTAEQARMNAQQQPFIFCPDPLVRITQRVKNNSKTVVPCAFTFTSMALIVNRSNQDAKKPTILKAYSLQEMVQFLTNESAEDARNLTIASPIEQPQAQPSPSD